MRITTIMCALAVGAALFFIVYYFMIEGFQTAEQTAKINAYLNAPYAGAQTTQFGKNADEICKQYGDADTVGDCEKCLDPLGKYHPQIDCGYWAQGKACIPRSGIYRITPKWLQDLMDFPGWAGHSKDKSTFDPKDFIYNIGKCGGDSCASFTSCKTCASASACGWCPTNKTCMDREAVTANWDKILSEGSKGSAGSPPPLMCPAPGSDWDGPLNSAGMSTGATNHSNNELIEEVGTCPPETCTDQLNCFDCTSKSNCGWCGATNKCIKVDSGGNHEASQIGGSTGSRGSAICPTGQIKLQSYMCPCDGMSDCATCATKPGCGWCVAETKCVNVNDNTNLAGEVNKKDCAAGIDGVATSERQCAPGAKLGNVRSEQSDYKPTAAELELIQDDGAQSTSGLNVNIAGSIGAGVIGSRPVSTATTSQATGNGVVPARQGGPYTITNQPGLFTSPFEEYVKVLIKSELASDGIPINEPFQNTPPTIINHLKKEVNKVVRKNF